MKIKLLFLTLLFSVLGWGQILTFEFSALAGGEATATSNFNNANLNASTISRGAGLTAAANASRFNATDWAITSIANAISGNDYMEFTITPNAGFQFDVSSIVIQWQRSGTGNTQIALRSSIDGYTTNLDVVKVVTDNTTTQTFTYTFAQANSTTAVTYRLYSYAEAVGGTGGPGDGTGNDIIVNGTVTSTSPTPEINITGNGNTILTGDIIPVATDFTDFGNVNIASSFSRSFVVQNLGSANLNVTAATISGTNASEFVITTSPVGTIAALGNSGLAIQFTPTASGIRTATVTITNNDSNEGSYTFAIQGNGVCVPAVIASVFPTSGPAGTEVTINASSGSLLGSTVSFNGTPATIVSSSAFQLVVVVPAGATTGTINITNTTTSCVTSTPTFTIINSDTASCQGAAISDLIIYELHDEQTGDGGFITLYNGTAATVNLTNYRIYRTSTYGDGNEINYATLTGTIASGALGIVTVDNLSCGYNVANNNGDITAGFNADDQIQLRNAAGTVVIDDVHAYTVGPGYYMVRNAGALSARTVFVAADWSTTPLVAGQCIPSAGLVPPTGGSQPSISAQPVIALTCASSTATLSVSATEGFVGGNALAYQWFVVAPNTTTWTALTNTGVYTGATTATLNISSLTGLDGYQYYCQVRENLATCYIATIAVKINTGATVWNGTVWSNGVPTLSKTATINGNYTTATNGSFSACNLTINATFTLNVSANSYVEVQNDVTNNGTFNILNNGSLVQINDLGVNTGNISYSRSTTGVSLDYVYWSSPVNGFSTPASGNNYTWNTTIANPNGGLGNWVTASNVIMQPALGYIMRGVLSRNYIGVPNNGIYTPAIARGNDTGAGTAGPNGIMRTLTDDNWTLLGNPYPSAISINTFLIANPELDGFVRLWTHNTLPSTAISDPFYGNFVYNYTASDYIAINGAGATSGPGTLSVIGGGQGFFVLMNAGAAATSTALFNNAMRDKGYSNSQFYRTANHIAEPTQELGGNIERNRIWIDLVSPTAETTRTLVAYVEGATLEKDRMFDALTDYKSAQNFYSLIGDEVMTIQGRSLPFDINDRVPMGIKIPTNGTYTIAIATVDGLFTGNAQKIYIEDKLLGTINDISEIPYQFVATQGITNDRFVLRYTNQALSNADFDLNENAITVFTSNNDIKINSSLESIKNYTVYNVLGQTLATKNNVNANQSVVSSIIKNNQALIVKVTLENGQTVIKKIIF
ncbi:choice-of-anchor D domain-containing protein [Flavobacterium sp.]|uniref:choice-of-anchor D domain-containing protein n=1 Tax=Flavobacterium sp. TaxID=239 RepID=UPI00374DD653